MKRLYVILEAHKTIVQEPQIIGVFDNDERASDIAEALALRFTDFTYPCEVVELNRLEVEVKESDLMKFMSAWTKLKDDK